MAFNRQIELDIGVGGTGLRVSQLNFSFNVDRSITAEYNTATFTIYNAKDSTRKNILTTGNNIVFRAGYEDEGIGTIFSGTIIKSNSYLDAADYITEIEAQDIGNNRNALQYQGISISYKAFTPLSIIINELATLINVPVTGVENATTILSNGFTFSGAATNMIKKIAGILNQDGIELFFDSNEMIIYRRYSQDSRFGVVRVSKESGLLGTVNVTVDEAQQDNKKRISFNTLLNYRLRPAAVVSVRSETTNGAYIIERVAFSGDNLGGDFFAQVEAVE